MKTEFWRHKSELLYFWPLVIAISLAFVVSGIVLMIVETPGFGGMIIGGIVPFIVFIVFVIFDNKFLSKVVFLEDGIYWKKFKKEIMFINWEEIIEIKSTSISMYSNYLSFVSSNGQIDVELTKKMYNTIMFICPHPNLKMMINNIEAFKYLHKKK